MSFLLAANIMAEPMVRIVEVDIAENSVDEFMSIVKNNMQQSMQQEEGVLAMYAVNVKGEPNKFRFFEIYTSATAYEAHRNTAYFKEYINKTQSMVVRKSFIDTENILLLNKPNFLGEMHYK